MSNVRSSQTPKSDNSPASDALCSIAGANLIGCNRDPQRYFTANAPPVPPEHKARLLDTDTYYYVQTRNRRMQEQKKYVTHNAVALNNEFGDQTEFFLSKGEVEPFLAGKRMLWKAPLPNGNSMSASGKSRKRPYPVDSWAQGVAREPGSRQSGLPVAGWTVTLAVIFVRSRRQSNW